MEKRHKDGMRPKVTKLIALYFFYTFAINILGYLMYGSINPLKVDFKFLLLLIPSFCIIFLLSNVIRPKYKIISNIIRAFAILALISIVIIVIVMLSL